MGMRPTYIFLILYKTEYNLRLKCEWKSNNVKQKNGNVIKLILVQMDRKINRNV